MTYVRKFSDFEAIQPKVIDPDNNTACTNRITKHVPCGFGYVIVSPYKELSGSFKQYRGENCAEKFIDALDNEYNIRSHRLNTNVPKIVRPEDEIKIRETNICSICLKKLNKFEKKAIDHDHITGEFRGLAHSDCNVNAKLQKKNDSFYA